jgi:para-aminobenzoate synthetase component 1
MAPSFDLPLVRAVAVEEPVRALRALAGLPHAFLLHSAMQDERARWSFFGADPFAVYRGAEYAEAIAAWRHFEALAHRDVTPPSAVPFTGGAVGYWAYDFGRRLERLPARAHDDLGLPDVLLGFYDVVGAYDHDTRQAWLFSNGFPCEGEERGARAEQRLAAFTLLLAGEPQEVLLRVPRAGVHPPVSTFERGAYLDAVERVRDHIRRGDIFQANLSQRWSVRCDEGPCLEGALTLYEALAERSPAPYAACLVAGDHAIVSASPERFLELRAGRVETRPIKGTRPRRVDPAGDARMAAELLASGKDRAENVMIVDVMRNDLGRACVTGSVRTPKLCELETFPQVHHLTSTVTGQLRAELDAFDLLHACFPAGSITGAPKIRAMEILESLEPVRRHVYTGAIGYVGWNGDADWSVAIRTALVTPRAVHFAAGGGITADSDPDAEYEETLDKAAGFFAALADVTGQPVADPGLAAAR